MSLTWRSGSAEKLVVHTKYVVTVELIPLLNNGCRVTCDKEISRSHIISEPAPFRAPLPYDFNLYIHTLNYPHAPGPAWAG